MLLKMRFCLVVLMFVGLPIAVGDEPVTTSASAPVTSQALAEWIDSEFVASLATTGSSMLPAFHVAANSLSIHSARA